MEKVVTIAIYTSDLGYTQGKSFADHEELNKLLSDGWAIKSHFITSTPGSTTIASVTFILMKS